MHTNASILVLALASFAAAAPAVFPSAATHSLLNTTIQALGGADALSKVHGITWQASSIYRSQTLTQNYNLLHSDQSVAETGSQNLSFSWTDATLHSRTDRAYRYNDYWLWAFPSLQPNMDWSLVTLDGVDASAYFNKGQNSFFAEDPGEALGYADPYLTEYLIHRSQQFALPWLLQYMNHSHDTSVTEEFVCGTSFPSLNDAGLELSLIMDPTTHLPYAVRSHEQHQIFGNSTSDLVLTNYSSVGELLLPHRLQTVYNSDDVLEDFIADTVTVNPDFATDYFDISSSAQPKPPPRSTEYPRSEVHEFFETGLWAGPFPFNVSDVNATHPAPGLEKVWVVYFGYADYVQLVIELEDGMLVADAPPHRSKLVIDWIREKFNKPIKYVVPSHHHRDHAGGIVDYVAAGAMVVVPEVAVEHYCKVNNGSIQFKTYSEHEPFVVRDKNVQFRAVWHDEAPHARDWMYAVVSNACPEKGDPVVVFNADVWSPGTDTRFDFGYARQWLDDARKDGLARDAIVVGTHGSSKNGTSTMDVLENLIEMTGVVYPALTADDWKAGGKFC